MKVPTKVPTTPDLGPSTRCFGPFAAGRLVVLLMQIFIAFQLDGFCRFSLPLFNLETNFMVKLVGFFYSLLLEVFYSCTSLIDPGSPKMDYSASSKNWCNACMAPKPERSHHCSTCSRCILRMDHHCIFTNSCIGLGNQPYFLAFVSWTTLGCGFVALASLPVVPSALLSLWAGENLWRALHLLVLCLSACVAFLLLWNLLLAQLHLLLRNETTIESLANWANRCTSSKYDRGVSENVREVFGGAARWIPRCFLDLLDGLDQFLAEDCC